MNFHKNKTFQSKKKKTKRKRKKKHEYYSKLKIKITVVTIVPVRNKFSMKLSPLSHIKITKFKNDKKLHASYIILVSYLEHVFDC